MPDYKEMTQEEATVLWESGVHTVEYAITDAYVNIPEDATYRWVPFTPTPYFWAGPEQHWAEKWRVETE